MTKKVLAHDKDLSTLAGRLAFAMGRKGANPNRIEVATGIARQTIGLMLKGITGKPSWPVLVQLCDYLGVRPEWLADGEDPMTRAPTVKDEAEAQLLRAFRDMSAGHKKDLAEIAQRWAEEDAPPDAKLTAGARRPSRH